MRYRKELGVFAAVALVIVGVGMAMAGVSPAHVNTNQGGGVDGYWLNFLTATSGSTDTGIGYSIFGGATDSKAYGVFFVGANGGTNSTGGASVASFGTGTPVQLSGSHSLSAGSTTRYAQRTDTARITISTSSYKDSFAGTAAASTWSSGYTSASGTSTDSFFASNAQGAVGNYASSRVVWDTTVVNLALLQATDSITVDSTVNAQVFRVLVDTANAGDTCRFLVVRPNGKVHDTQGVRTASATSETFAMPNGFVLDSGLSIVYAFFYNSNEAKVRIITGEVFAGLGGQTTSITGGAGALAFNNLTSAIAQGTLTVNSNGLTSLVAQVFMSGVTAPGPRDPSDPFNTVDSNTSGFDTRMPNTVVDVVVKDAAGAYVTSLPSGQTFLLVLRYNFSGLSSSTASSLRLLHHNEATNSWEVVSNSASDSANSRVVGYVNAFSKYAIGNISSGAAAAPADDDNCVIQNTIGHTSLAGLMPSLRGVRDVMMGNALGRLFVSGYYGFAAFAMILFAAAGAGFAFSKRG